MILTIKVNLPRCVSLIRHRLVSFSAISSPANRLNAISSHGQRCQNVATSARDEHLRGHAIIASQSPKLSLVGDKSFPEFLLEKFDRFGNRRAIIDGYTGQEYSYPQLQEFVLKVGSGLTKLGFKKGDVFAIYCPNIVEYPIIYLSILSLGGIATTAPSLASVPELCMQMKDSKAQYIITVPPFASNAKDVAHQCGMKEVFVVGEAEGCRPFSSLLQDDGNSFPTNIEINPKEDVAVIPYSSGTTGLPKGVMLTHFNLSSNIQQCADGKEHYKCTSDDNILGLLPFFHIFGLSVVQGMALYHGATIVSLPKFDEQMFLETVEKYKVSQMFVAPPLVLFLAKSPMVRKYDFSSLNDIVSGAAPLSKDLEAMACEQIGIKNVRQGYGLTETSPVTHLTPLAKFKAGSVGTCVPNTEAKVIDLETGETLGENQRGELCIRGPQVTKGYLNNPQATKDTIDSDGWFRTGDVGYYDSDHYFYIVDRCKELIKYKGYQVAPGELEAVLTTHPKIQDAAVIGVPDEEGGELPKAFICASGITTEEVNSYLDNLVAPYKKLRGGIEFVDEIPKSASGKILRRMLKDKETADRKS